MTTRKSDFTLPTNSLDELFSSQEERDNAKLERVKKFRFMSFTRSRITHSKSRTMTR